MEKKPKSRPSTKSHHHQGGDAGGTVGIPTTGLLLDALFNEVRRNGNSEHARALVLQLRRFADAGDLLARAMIDRAVALC